MTSLAMVDRIPATPDYGGECDHALVGDCYNFHHLDFDIDSDTWGEYLVPFADVVQEDWGSPLLEFDPARIAKVQFMFSEQAANPETGEFELWIDEVGIYGGEPWPGLAPTEHHGACAE